jgi:hypothetical protein
MYTLKNEGQEGKKVLFRNEYQPWQGEREDEQLATKEGEYGQCTLCTCMKIEQ